MNKPAPSVSESSSPWMNPGSLLWQSIAAIVSAILLLLSFPVFDFDFLAWIALAPLLRVLAQGVTWKRALWLGWLTGLVFTFLAENWIAHSMTRYGQMLTAVAYLVAFFFAAVLAIFPAIFAVVIALLVNRFGWRAVALAPAVWVATEYLRPLITGVTWNAIGVSQAGHYLIARLSQYGGVYLVSAEVVTISSLIVLLLRVRERGVIRSAAILSIFAVVFFALPELRGDQSSPAGPIVSVIGVQPNLPLDDEMSDEVSSKALEDTFRLTRDALAKSPDQTADVIAWAESPMTLFYETDAALRRKLDELARETGSYYIINTVTRDDWRYHNSIHTINPRPDSARMQLQRYDKIRLVPFGEYVPWRPVLGRLVPAIVGDFTPGSLPVVNLLQLETRRAAVLSGTTDEPAGSIERTTNFVRVGAFICYEAAYPALVRGFVLNGASLLINLSNDSWFGNTAGARQHLAHAVMRAIENDRDLIRVTNTGVSALIKADGRIIDPLPMFTAGTGRWQAETNRNLTFYTRHGDWFAIGCLILTVAALAINFIRRSPGPKSAGNSR